MSFQDSSLLNADFFARKVEVVAPDLIGCHLFTTINGECAGGMIIETEAYDQNDIAAHCYSANRVVAPETSDPMKFAGGKVYFYYTRFGRCLNFTCDRENFGSAVLIRALRPSEGPEIMRARRRSTFDTKSLSDEEKYRSVLCNGPQNLCDSLGFCDSLHKQSLEGLSAVEPPFELRNRALDFREGAINISDRIGIEKQLRKKYPRPSEATEIQIKDAIGKKWRWFYKP